MQRCMPGKNRPPPATLHLAPAIGLVRPRAERKTLQYQIGGSGAQSAVVVSVRGMRRAIRPASRTAFVDLQPFEYWGTAARITNTAETNLSRAPPQTKIVYSSRSVGLSSRPKPRE